MLNFGNRQKCLSVLEKKNALLKYIHSIAVSPRIYLDPGPVYAVEGRNFTPPNCHVTGHPQPVVTWAKSFGQLPRERLQINKGVITLLDARRADSDNYLCTARNFLGTVVKRTVLVVATLPQFSVKPAARVVTAPGETLTLNCSATGDPQPVISWKRQGAQLPVGTSLQINGGLEIRDIKTHDRGNYICVATSAGVLDVETVTYVDVRKGKLGCVFRNFMKFVSHSPSQTLNTYLRKAQNEQNIVWCPFSKRANKIIREMIALSLSRQSKHYSCTPVNDLNI